jgi:ABC-type Fe3+/spermidine/putrescine transport system ATPase subunit
MAIMNDDGNIEQVGNPKEIYQYPTSRFVASFVGTTNIIDGTIMIEGSTYFLKTSIGNTFIIEKNNLKGNDTIRPIALSIRPEQFLISKHSPIENISFHNVIHGKVHAIVYYGHAIEYTIVTELGLIKVLSHSNTLQRDVVINYDDYVMLSWQPHCAIVLEK